MKLYFSDANIYLISLVFSESGRLSLANEIDARQKEDLKHDSRRGEAVCGTKAELRARVGRPQTS